MLKFLPILLLSLLSLSNSQEPPSFFPPELLDVLETEVDTVILGIGESSVIFSIEENEQTIEFGTLPGITNENEWTFNLITNDGEVYSFVSQSDGEVNLVGPNGYDENMSQYLAEFVEVPVNEVANSFAEMVTFGVMLAIGAENGENAVEGAPEVEIAEGVSG